MSGSQAGERASFGIAADEGSSLAVGYAETIEQRGQVVPGADPLFGDKASRRRALRIDLAGQIR
ncbi:MAG: hypothetical protein EBW14_09730, partial [Oxalobacteraceae bacterium]|nr:hypothetical protein [Oxalobacteraceae bacterium]